MTRPLPAEPATGDPDPAGLRRCVVVGGTGAVGDMFVELLLRSGAEVSVVDRAADPCGGNRQVRYLRGDITAVGPELTEEIGAADMVMLAVPEPVALDCAGTVADLMREDALLVDTLSVKGRIARAFGDTRPDIQVVGLNPMFAPSLGMAGRPVAVVVVRDGPRARELIRLVETWGGRPVLVDAEEHDRLTGAAQALTHAAVLAFGLALTELGVGIRELGAIAPPPHATLLAMLARIASGAPEVYWDVQAANPRAAAARGALAGAVRRLAELIDSGDESAFAATLERLRSFLGPDLDRYRELCARAFEITA